MNVGFPYRFDARGRTADVSDEQHVRDLIEQVLFTSPGERVNRPDFGSGLLQLVFEPAGDSLVSTVQLGVQGALQRWLDAVILVEAVDVTLEDATVRVKVRYIIRRSQTRRTDEFSRSRP
jgi:phage baseplate assembly protein W